MIICFIFKMHCKRLVQMQAARSQRAQGALEDPTALPQRAV